MRILIDYRPALRTRTGVGEYIHGLASALGILASAGAAPARDDVAIFSSSWKDRLDTTALPPVPWVDRRIPVRVLTLLWNRFEWPPVEMLTGRGFDVVHSANPLLVPARAAAQVVTIHDLDFLTHPEWTRAEIRRDYPALVKTHADRADRVIVSSRYAAGQVEHTLEVAAEKIAVCPAGAPDWTPRQSQPETGYILFLGTLEPRKNVGILLDAYRVLTSRSGRVPDLVLAGSSTPAAAPWLEALRHAPFAGRARYLGYVPDAQRRSLYEGAAVLVVPSFEEGFGLPVLEAMAAGVPVVASNRGSLPEVLGEAGILIEPDDAEAVADAIRNVTGEPELAMRMVACGIERAKTYTWDRTARAALGAYEAAIAHRSRR